MNKYIFASFNKHKLIEISNQISNIDIQSLYDLGYTDEIIEFGSNLQENALIKARVIYDRYSIPCISDDTGLEVHALDNAPGVYSARYAGKNATAEDNVEKLLIQMKNIKDRRARFRTVICLKNSQEEKFFEGVVEGVISDIAVGKSGFGYDPVFRPNGYSKTFSEMSLEEKNNISHRSRAVAKLVNYLSSQVLN
ncbi:MAG: non-canonical purine NTP pyrophosphatase, RdgB/HAM1 family [Flavobacteriales bacterium]|nr:non-canonical purine NTP pyrophosphatase, RdgB/HAM1 family [Flavobacteriales bacterium]|tara:strand:+ start:12212 stop:12796 length:585 start_codon:yes stop_codon:yes gene_type:complete